MKKHILAIDDEADILSILKQVLTDIGYRVSTTHQAHEAHRIVKEDPPDLIISDLQMEDTDGLDLIQQFKEALPNVPVILLTGAIFDPEVVEGNLMKKVSCYIGKTSSLWKITQEVQRLLGDLKADSAPVA